MFQNTLIKLMFLTLLLFFGISADAQNISGEWNGMITQEAGGISGQYYFSLHLKQEGQKITGFTKVELYEGSKRVLFARKALTGIFDGKTLFFQETKIIEHEMNTGATSLCLISGKLSFIFEKAALCLSGTWGGSTEQGTPCSPGKIKVCSTIPIAFF